MDLKDLTGLAAVVLALTTPIAAVISIAVMYCKQKNYAYRLRSEIASNRLDNETARTLLEETSNPEGNRTRPLRIGATLVCMGVGAIIANQFYDTDEMMFYFVAAIGAGVGLLAAFVTEWLLNRRKTTEQADETEETVSE